MIDGTEKKLTTIPIALTWVQHLLKLKPIREFSTKSMCMLSLQSPLARCIGKPVAESGCRNRCLDLDCESVRV